MSCAICNHRKVVGINIDLRAGMSLGLASEKYKLPRPSLGRHRLVCLNIRRDASTTRPEESGDGLHPADAGETASETLAREEALPVVRSAQIQVNLSKPKKKALSPETATETGKRVSKGVSRRTSPDGSTGVHQGVATEDVETRAVDLKVRGKGFTAIARELGLTRNEVVTAVEAYMARTRTANESKQLLHRHIDLKRLDNLLDAMWDRATKGGEGKESLQRQDAAVANVLRILERRAKLLGLDVPTGPSTVNIITHPAVQPFIQQYMTTIRRVLEVTLPPLLSTEDQAKVLSALAEAAVVLAEEGERALDTWLVEKERALQAIETTAEVIG